MKQQTIDIINGINLLLLDRQRAHLNLVIDHLDESFDSKKERWIESLKGIQNLLDELSDSLASETKL